MSCYLQSSVGGMAASPNQNQILRQIYDRHVAKRKAELQTFQDIIDARIVVRRERATAHIRDMQDPTFADAYNRHTDEERAAAIDMLARHERFLLGASRDGRERYVAHMHQLGAIAPMQAPESSFGANSWIPDIIAAVALLVLSVALFRRMLHRKS